MMKCTVAMMKCNSTMMKCNLKMMKCIVAMTNFMYYKKERHLIAQVPFKSTVINMTRQLSLNGHILMQGALLIEVREDCVLIFFLLYPPIQ